MKDLVTEKKNVRNIFKLSINNVSIEIEITY